jgi:hypothetical protein
MKPSLKWLVVRLGDDTNWWVDETSDNVYWGTDSLSLLDPNQVAYLHKTVGELEDYGFDPGALDSAFQIFEVASELTDGRMRLRPSEHSIGDEGVQLFALPDLLDEEKGAYPDLLDQLISLRVKYLNATHDYFQPVTEDDLEEELQSRNADRYFASTCIHVFNELEDILTWKPAEWDEKEESKDEQPADDESDEE